MTDIFDLGETPVEEPDQPAPKRRRSRLVITLLSVTAGLVAILVGLGVAFGIYAGNLASTYDAKTDKITNAFPSGNRPEATKDGAKNILLMGSDSRGDATSIDSSKASDQRTDTMMLVHIDADRKAVWVMSIMRDLWVTIPGHGEHKINAAFAYGGSALTVQTIEQLLDVRIDHVAIVDFQGFEGMTDALGGVDVESPSDFTARGQHFTKGTNHVNGEQALKFVRERYSFANGDYQRVANQQAFLRAIVDKTISKDTLTSPSKITDFVGALSEYLSVDDSLSATELAKLGVSLRGVDKQDVHFFTIPTGGTGTSADGQSIVLQNSLDMPGLRSALGSDSLDSFEPASE
ncbi:LCP family protein [Curtobacterium sp. MWU13-2055]|uniref:LCP family protein n=1 Tax=Curtobacterium sp. MWU13-2055 TaxID=2931928 RepID=UPI00200D0ED8|nr:LCP family protein [Curtobacterium sp. MWU13-2055]